MDLINTHAVVNSILFSLIGILVLLVSFYLVERVTPENLYKELVEKQNSAVAIVAGAFMIAIAIIIGCAIHG